MKDKMTAKAEKLESALNTSLPKKQNSSLEDKPTLIESANLEGTSQEERINTLWDSIKKQNEELQKLKQLRAKLQKEKGNTLYK